MEFYYKICFGFIIILIVLFFCIRSMLNRSKKDWKTLEDLEEKAKKVITAEEAETLHKELLEKAKNIHNQFIGYLRGIHKITK